VIGNDEPAISAVRLALSDRFSPYIFLSTMHPTGFYISKKKASHKFHE
jgi:hypothetical protein